MQKFVPVVSNDGKPLMPTTNWRANEMVSKGKALRRFKTGIFYIKLIKPTNDKVQSIVVGIDPGSKREGFTVKSESHTYLNILSDAVTWVSKNIETRRIMRHFRRFRKTPFRPPRLNKSRGSLIPSTKSRWEAKVRILNLLGKIFPISSVVVEDIKAVSKKGKRKWNRLFSPLEVGKNWFYSEIRKKYVLSTLQGYETFELRKWHGLKKISNKMSENFYAHNVDSWVLSNSIIGGHLKPDNIEIFKMTPMQFRRRKLHALQFSVGNIRRPYGGTMSLGLKRGSIVKHTKHGICYVGGTTRNRISLHSLETGIRLCQNAKYKEINFMAYNYWKYTS